MARPTIKITRDRVADLDRAIRSLADRRVLVGFPQETAGRKEGDISNAEIAYIQNFGAPEANIPPREFMEPGVRGVLPQLTEGLKHATQIGIEQSDAELDKALMRVGMIGAQGIKAAINSNTPPPLAESTVAARIARRKSASWKASRQAGVAANIGAGNAPGEGIFRTLVDTAQLRNAATYVIRLLRSKRDLIVGKSTS